MKTKSYFLLFTLTLLVVYIAMLCSAVTWPELAGGEEQLANTIVTITLAVLACFYGYVQGREHGARILWKNPCICCGRRPCDDPERSADQTVG